MREAGVQAIEAVETAWRPTVVIVEDHSLLAEALVSGLRSADIHADVVSGASADDIVKQTAELSPDVVLIDLMLRDDVALSFSLVAPLVSLGTSVLVLTGDTNPSLLGAYIEAGAWGIVSKSDSFSMVLDKVVRAGRRQAMLHEDEREALLLSLSLWRAVERDRLACFERLTERERVVLSALMDGASAEDIARASLVSLTTVRSQIRAILQKLEVRSQIAAVAAAHRAGWRLS
jgi:Response regulator containing a CheY-like receiver domain and an HTH DNA-binding domain